MIVLFKSNEETCVRPGRDPVSYATPEAIYHVGRHDYPDAGTFFPPMGF